MKSDIHPKWYNDCKVSCACGNAFTMGATKPEIRVEICSHCHPFFTGEMKFVDTLGRVEKFQAKQKQGAVLSAVMADKKKKKKQKEIERRTPKSLKEMLMNLQ